MLTFYRLFHGQVFEVISIGLPIFIPVNLSSSSSSLCLIEI